MFGTDYTDGFNIQNRKDVVPYHYYASKHVLYLLNNKFEIVHQFDLWSKYEDTILKLFLGDVFDDVVIVSGIWIYILSYDLRLKSRINMTATGEDGNAILDLDTLLSQGLAPILSGEYYEKDDQGRDVVIFDGSDKTGMYVDDQMPTISLINYPYNHDRISITNRKNLQGKITVKLSDGNLKAKPKQNYVCPTKMTFKEDAVTSGSVFIASELCKQLCEYNSILYKNNIYIPINQSIMKIIMCPDCEYDFEVFTEKERENYPAVARMLTSEEFFLNYTKTNDSKNDLETIGLEQGFISVDNKIKHIHITENGKIYGLNFDHYGIAKDGDTIYGLYGSEKYVQ